MYTDFDYFKITQDLNKCLFAFTKIQSNYIWNPAGTRSLHEKSRLARSQRIENGGNEIRIYRIIQIPGICFLLETKIFFLLIIEFFYFIFNEYLCAQV